MEEPDQWIEPAEARPLDGGEAFPGSGATVLDFWRFAFSDLRNNVIRGVLAEFLVARALGSELAVRRSWDIFDVLAPEGVRVEVKSAAYLQSWRQRRLSTIRFSGLTGLSWDDKQGWGAEREVRADVFVFALHTCVASAAYDPLNVAQWDFYVAPASAVREGGARSVGMAFLRERAHGPLPWSGLRDAVVALGEHGPIVE